MSGNVLLERPPMADSNDPKKETVQARRCVGHRIRIALEHPEAWGCGQLGDSCDLYEGREPRSVDGFAEGGFSVR